jgi:hypothetical protein
VPFVDLADITGDYTATRLLDSLGCFDPLMWALRIQAELIDDDHLCLAGFYCLDRFAQPRTLVRRRAAAYVRLLYDPSSWRLSRSQASRIAGRSAHAARRALAPRGQKAGS